MSTQPTTYTLTVAHREDVETSTFEWADEAADAFLDAVSANRAGIDDGTPAGSVAFLLEAGEGVTASTVDHRVCISILVDEPDNGEDDAYEAARDERDLPF